MRNDRKYGSNKKRQDQELKVQKSLGALYKTEKTKPRSPEMTGPMTIQRHTLEAIVRELKRGNVDTVACNIAAWCNLDRHGRKYLTVEISPRSSPPRDVADRKFDIFDFILDEQT